VLPQVATSRIFSVIDRVPAIDTKPWDTVGKERTPTGEQGHGAVIAPKGLKGKIEIRNVRFTYPVTHLSMIT
jgi:hypothetical protein